MTTYIAAFDGRLAADPELETTASGTPVCTAVVLVNHRTQSTEGEWVDAEPSRRNIKAWRNTARRLSSLARGDAVVVIGEVHTEAWTDKDTGEKRSREIVTVESIGKGLLLPGNDGRENLDLRGPAGPR
jgi:single-strand DNA-binding protein